MHNAAVLNARTTLASSRQRFLFVYLHKQAIIAAFLQSGCYDAITMQQFLTHCVLPTLIGLADVDMLTSVNALHGYRGQSRCLLNN